MEPIRNLVPGYKEWLRETQNRDELYKWIAVQHFQDSWDVNAVDFHGMLKESIRKAGNLLFQNSRGYLIRAARERPEDTRKLMGELFDQNISMDERYRKYVSGMEGMLGDLRARAGKHINAQQDERTVAFLLSMRFPAEHYLYKDSYYQKLCRLLGTEPAAAGTKYRHFVSIADEVKSEVVLTDSELLDLHHRVLTEDSYHGDDTNLIVQNLLYVSLDQRTEQDHEEIGSDARWWLYAPGEGAKYWDNYADEGVMAIGWREIGDLNEYDTREDIAVALREAKGTPDKSYMNASLACWEFVHVMKPGDVIIPKRGLYEYIGFGIVSSEYRYEPNREDQPNVRDVKWIKMGSWPEPNGQIVLKTLTDITKYPDYVERLRGWIVDGSVPEDTRVDRTHVDASTRRNFILYGPPGTGKTYKTVDFALSIIEGYPLTGYEGEERDDVMRRFHAMTDSNRIEFVTFHPSFSYEEFIEGIRPRVEQGAVVFDIRPGVFLRLCDLAATDPENPYVLVVDEISRGNAARVFGELITLIEDDKRSGAPNQLATTLPYSGRRFSVPANVYIVGTMNTADRSVEALDTAFRRRFSFVEMLPRPELLSLADTADVDIDLGSILAAMNWRIEKLIDRDHQIGHAYFMRIASADDPLQAIREVFVDRVIPLLREYFYSDQAKIGLVLGKRFVVQGDDGIHFADFDPDLADRYSGAPRFVLTDPDEWSASSFRSIYDTPED
ncbi:MAG: AAA family ATPase [Alkalispirochaeta sp.]